MTEHIRRPAGAGRSPQQIVAETEPHPPQVLEMLVALLLTHQKAQEASKRGCAVSTALLAIRSVLAQAKLARESGDLTTTSAQRRGLLGVGRWANSPKAETWIMSIDEAQQAIAAALQVYPEWLRHQRAAVRPLEPGGGGHEFLRSCTTAPSGHAAVTS